MLIPQYQVLVLKLSPIYTVSLNTVFSIPQNQCYPGTPCTYIPTFLIRAHLSSCVLFSLAHIKGCPLALAKIAIATLPTFCSYQAIIHITAQNTY